MAMSNHKIMSNNVVRYLYHRIKKPMDVDQGLLAIIKQLCAFLNEEFDIQTASKQDELLMKLCEGLAAMFEPNKILNALWADDPQFYARFWHPSLKRWSDAHGETDVWDKLIAAMATHSHDLTSQLLRDLPGPICLNIRGEGLLDDAHLLQDQALVDIIVQHLRSLELKKNAMRLLRSQNLVSRDSVFNLERSIRAATLRGRGHPGITQTLVKLYTDFMPLPTNSAYTEWLVSVIEHRHVDSLKVLCNMRHRSSWTGRSRVFSAACDTKDRAYVDMLLDIIPIDLTKGAATTSPIFQAVRSGHVPCVEAVLERSKATLSLQVTSNLRAIGMRFRDISALDLTMHRKDVPMVKCLLDNGSPMPDKSDWPAHKKINKMLQLAFAKKDKKGSD
jgi:hypothetical protein